MTEVEREVAPSRAQSALSKGDVLYQLVRPYQKNHFYFDMDLKKQVVASTGFAQIRVRSDVDGQFLTQLLLSDRINKEVTRRCTGTSYPAINSADFGEIKVCFPAQKEQLEISGFLFKLEEKIKLQQEKIALLKEQKKGYMQKIFNRELRFKDENSNEYPKWNKTRLDKILTERKSYHIKSNEIPHATLSTEGIYLKTERYDRDFLVRNQEKKYKISNLNDICYNPANLKFGVITRNQIGTVIFSPIYITFEIVDGYYPVFIEYMVIRKDFINKVRKYEEGTVYERMAVKPKDFLSFEVLIPCYEEQEKIGDFLKSFDNLIEKEVEYLELIKSQKKSFMQNMFV